MIVLRRSPKKTFWQRLANVALFWGLPTTCLELIGLPRQSIGLVLLVEVPATILGVLVFTLIELGVVRLVRRYATEPTDVQRPRLQ